MGWCAPPQGPKAPRVENPRGGGASTLLGGQVSPSWPPPLPSRWDLEGAGPLSPSPIYSEGVGGQPYPSLGATPFLLIHLLLLRSAWRSPAGEPRAPSPPCRRAVEVFPQLLLTPCWIKKEETSPGCTCVERGGAVRSALDRIFRDLNRREYDSINRILVTLPLSDLQGYEDALPLSRC